jgi:hypothetical protein
MTKINDKNSFSTTYLWLTGGFVPTCMPMLKLFVDKDFRERSKKAGVRKRTPVVRNRSEKDLLA